MGNLDNATIQAASLGDQGLQHWFHNGWQEVSTWSWTIVSTNLLALLATVLAIIFFRRRYFSPISNVPGPFFASFSRFWHVRHIIRGDQNLELVRQHDKHGHFVRISHSEVSVSHPDAIRRILLAPLNKGDWYNITRVPDQRFRPAISLMTPKAKAEMAKYIAPAYLHSNVIKSEEAMDGVIRKLCDWMDRHARDGTPMHLDKFFTYAAFDITGEVLFSRSFGFLDEGRDVGGSIAMNLGLEKIISTMGFWHHFMLILFNPFMTWLNIIPMGHNFNTTMAALKDRQENPDARFDMVAHWLRSLDKASKESRPPFTQRDMEATLTANVGAGSDTISAGLQSFVYHLIRQPEGWQRVRDEIHAAQKEGRCQSAVIRYDDAVQLPYLQACVKEALRIFGPVPMGLPRKAPAGGLTIGDRAFPAGTTLSVNPWVMHYSTEFWGADARAFRPGRWLEPGAAERERRFFTPWGAGYASCPGQNVARIQLLKITATVVRDYDVRQVDPDKEWKWAAYFTAVPEDWPVYVARAGEGKTW